MMRGGERFFYLVDALGSTTALTRLDGSVANQYTYDAFGTTHPTGTVAEPVHLHRPARTTPDPASSCSPSGPTTRRSAGS